MTESFYNGVRIFVEVYELADGAGFSANITLARRDGDTDVEFKYVTTRVTFPSRAEAKDAAMLEARSIIDRGI